MSHYDFPLPLHTVQFPLPLHFGHGAIGNVPTLPEPLHREHLPLPLHPLHFAINISDY
ncbi:MAG: hypothetical protein KDH98_13005 [Calditrichaeota bacterium]|nr:hypothetical protein [Calditrichota bacterium]